MSEEVHYLSSLDGDSGLRNDNISARHDLITGDIFNAFASQIKEKCPLIDSILETLVVAKSDRNVHKTNAFKFKFKCASHVLAALIHIRSSKTSTDFPLLFGLLCISYGAGKQFINMLNAIGLSLHWDTM